MSGQSLQAFTCAGVIFCFALLIGDCLGIDNTIDVKPIPLTPLPKVKRVDKETTIHVNGLVISLPYSDNIAISSMGEKPAQLLITTGNSRVLIFQARSAKEELAEMKKAYLRVYNLFPHSPVEFRKRAHDLGKAIDPDGTKLGTQVKADLSKLQRIWYSSATISSEYYDDNHKECLVTTYKHCYEICWFSKESNASGHIIVFHQGDAEARALARYIAVFLKYPVDKPRDFMDGETLKSTTRVSNTRP